MSERKITKRKTFAVRFTRSELVHLRDLFGVYLPTELKQTVSQALAIAEERPMLETRLWTKIAAACTEAELPMAGESPDFAVIATTSPVMSVFQIAREQDDTEMTPESGGEEEDEDE